jgi:hypothetical protein
MLDNRGSPRIAEETVHRLLPGSGGGADR